MEPSTSRFAIQVAVIGGVLLAGGCSALGQIVPSAPPRQQAETLPGQLEAVHAAAVAKGEAVFWVSSNGCTDKDDLSPVVRRSGDQAVLTLRRINADTCRETLPEGVELRWSFQELGLTPDTRLTIENPYQAPPGV